MNSLQKDSDEIEQRCIELCYHMKGVTWNEAWGMSPKQRTKIVNYVNKIYKEQEESYSGKTSM